MTRSDTTPPEPPDARALWEEYRRRKEAGEPVDLEEYCARHPEAAVALRALDSLLLAGPGANDGDGATGTAPDGTFAEALAGLPRTASGSSAGSAGQTAGSSAPLEPGQRVGPYSLERILGEGGFAVVYLARQEEPVRREVALKTLKPGLDTREIMRRFELERQALAMMSHPAIARVYDAGATADGRPYFAMEHVPGLPITRYSDERQLDTAARLRLLLRVCEAVQHAHQRAIVHRDLKPANLLVTDVDGQPLPKVIDFGIAKATEQGLTGHTIDTRAGHIVGTPLYMSPEQAGGGGAPVDTRTDIYALGVILYELLTGVPPFDASELRGLPWDEVIRWLREKEPTRPSTRVRRTGAPAEQAATVRGTTPGLLSRRLRGDLDWITLRALAKDPEDRYPAVSELAADIDRHLRSLPVLAGPPGIGYRLRKLARRRRRDLITAGVLLLLASIAGAAALRVAESREAARRVREAGRLVEAGRSAVALAIEARDRTVELAERHRDIQLSMPRWMPIWYRDEELEAWRLHREALDRMEAQHARAVLLLTRAVNLAPPESAPWVDGTDLLRGLRQEILEDTSESIGRVLLAEAVGQAVAERVVRDRAQTLRWRSEPPGADLYCFRHELHDQVLLPLPFAPRLGRERPSDGVRGGPRLVVEVAVDRPPRRTPFRPGDVIQSVAGVEVALRSGFAKAALEAESGEELTVGILRDGAPVSVRWTPFPGERPDPLVDLLDDLGLAFEGYPLELVEDCRVGETSADHALEVELPPGSYLFVLRRGALPDVRYPVRVPREGSTDILVPLVSEVPDGFVYVPAGSFPSGGDERAYQGLETAVVEVDGFCMARFEVTFEEYLEFLNHPETRARMAKGPSLGEVAPLASPAVDRPRPAEWVQLLPKDNQSNRVIVRRADDGTWRYRGGETDRWPVLGVSYLAAREYASWRTRHDAGGWRYRLATDLEWEKAARGDDRRIRVWGDYMVWSFCWSFDGTRTGRASVVGRCPLDESVFGIRDLMGSAMEFVTSRASPHHTLIMRRGGGWDAVDDLAYRLASRSGMRADLPSRGAGIRLVAELSRVTGRER